MAGRCGEEPHAGLDRAALGIGRAVIEPPDPCKGDRARTHGARLQRDVEVAVDQPLAADLLGRLAQRNDFGMGRWVLVGQRPIGGGGNDLVIVDHHASDRNLARFSGVFGRFERQIHERRGFHASYHCQKPATSSAFSKSGYRFCLSMRIGTSAHNAFWPPPKRDYSCPATATKTTIPAAGVIGARPRVGPASRVALRRSSPSAAQVARVAPAMIVRRAATMTAVRSAVAKTATRRAGISAIARGSSGM